MSLIKIAFRNVFRHKRRTVLTALSMFGGFVLSAFFIGWADGTYNNIINAFTGSQTGHVQIHHKGYLDRPSLYRTVDSVSRIGAFLDGKKEVRSWAPRLYSAGLVSLADKTAGVRIIGIDPQRESQTIHFQQRLVEGKLFADDARQEAIVGKGLASILKARLGDEAVIVSQGADGSIANDRYKIVGITDSGDELGDRMAFYLPLKAAQELLVLDGRIHELAVTLHQLGDVDRLNEELTTYLATLEPGLVAETWRQFARSFYNAMSADKEGMYIMLLVIMLVVAVGVLNTVLMSVLERQREYGVLKALGTRPVQIVKMVLLEINLLGLACIVLGTVVGLFINHMSAITGYTLAEPISYGGMKFQQMMGEVNARSFIIPTITVLLVATLVGLFPAIKAARMDPARSMRTH